MRAKKNKSLKSLKSYGPSFGESYQKILLCSFSVSEKPQSVCSFVRSFIKLLCCMQQQFEQKRKSNDFSKYFVGAHQHFTADRAKSHNFERFLKKRMLMFSHFQSNISSGAFWCFPYPTTLRP